MDNDSVKDEMKEISEEEKCEVCFGTGYTHDPVYDDHDYEIGCTNDWCLSCGGTGKKIKKAEK
jgi:hypothetical protein